jgi:peptidoglycan/LPS O-acetylase OafA/YrhL
MRTEIQALRAAAVALVVAYHLWPSAVDGGYIGVDVFFVISGFLITGQLLRAAERDGRVSLADFWARRARRILPAALVVLAFCAVATKLVVPETQWQRFLDEVVASAAYVENWHLANTATDYLASDDASSPVRHFWSLSVEEQFYVVWPLLIMLALAISNTRRSIAAVLGTVTVASFVYGVIATANSPADAFFITPTRAWEFGIGGLLALLPDAAKAAEQAKRRRPPLRTRSPGRAWSRSSSRRSPTPTRRSSPASRPPCPSWAPRR